VGILGYTIVRDPGLRLPEQPPPTLAPDPTRSTWHEPVAVEIDADLASRFLGGDDDFGVLRVDARAYRQLNDRTLAALRLGAAYCSSSTPLTEEITLGGDVLPGLLRGHNPSAFRGQRMLNMNIETRHAFADTLDGVLFADLARVFDGPNPTNGLIIDYGAGIRTTYLDASLPLALFYARGGSDWRVSFATSHGF
jgi:hemolysin activation/secretion protein